MRSSIFFSLFIIFSFLANAQYSKDEERERQRIAESKIKKSIQWTHRFTQDKPNPKGHKTTETTYDKNGNVIEVVNYRSDGDISSRLLYKYNNQNQRIEYLMYQKEKEAKELKLSYKQSFHYNESGSKTHEVVFDGIAGYRITYAYNPDGSNKEIVKFSSTNTVAEKWVYSYVGQNQEIKIYNADNQLISTVQKKVDSKGNILEEVKIGPNGKEQKRTTNVYDDRSRVVEMAEYYSGTLSKKLFYKYNNLDVVTEISQQNPDGKKFIQSTYKHDTNGNVLEERWSEDNSDELSHKQSKYDKNGVLVEMESYYAPYKFRVQYKYTYEYY
jgi:hypothetical protein